MAAMNLSGIEQVFTSHDNPKGNAETGRLMRTIKEELLRPQEFPNVEVAREAMAQWIAGDCNRRYVHPAPRCMSPLEFEAALRQREAAQAAAQDDSLPPL